MAEQLEIRVGADLAEATKAFEKLHKDIAKSMSGGEASFKKFVSSYQKEIPKVTQASNKATQSLTDLSRIAQDAPYGFIGIANNINPLLESFGRLKAESGSTGAALKSLVAGLAGPAGIGLAVGVVSSLLVTFGDKIFGSGKKAEDAAQKLDGFKKAVDGIFDGVSKEASQVQTLVAVLQNETTERRKKLAALKELQSINPELFGQLKLEGDVVNGLSVAYKQYAENLKTVLAAKITQTRLEEVTNKILKAEGAALTKGEKDFIDSLKKSNDARKAKVQDSNRATLADKFQAQQTGELNNLYKQQADLLSKLGEFSKGIKVGGVNFDDKKAPKVRVSKVQDIEDLKVRADLITVYPDKLTIANKDLNFDSEEIKNAFDRVSKIKPITIQPRVNVAPDYKANPTEFVSDLQKKLTDIGNQFGEQLGISIGEGIGAAFGGGDIKDIFASIFNVIGSFISEVGKQLIIASTAMAAVKKALAGLFANPVAGLAVGVGLVALGGIIKKSVGNVKPFAKGGLVSGPTNALIGEGIGTSRSNPEVVTPLDKLKGMLSGLVGPSIIGGEFRVRGRDLVHVLAAETNSQKRRF